MEGSSNSAVGFDRENAMVPLSFEGDNSSVASINEGSESPLSSWDSEPETDIPSLINCDGASEGSLQSINMEENYLDMEGQNQFVGVENTDDGLLWEMDNRSYDELLKKFMEKEEEIIKLNVQVENSEAQLYNVRDELKLKEEELNKQKELSEEEIFKLKIQIQKTDNRLDNVREELKLKEEELNKQKELSEQEIFKLKIQIEKTENRFDNVCEELKLKEEELSKQKELSEEEIFNLKIQIEKSENRLDKVQEELNLKAEKLQKQIAENAMLQKELERNSIETHQLHCQRKMAHEKMVKLELELLSNRKHIQMLADSVIMHESIAANDEQEVQKLKSKMLDLQEEINCLREELGQKMHLVEAANKDLEMVMIERDEANAKIDKLDAEICSKDDTFKLYATQQMVLQDEIKCLREELGWKMHLVEVANKELEMVVTERDEANSKIDKLEAELCSCNDKLSDVEKYIEELKASLKKHLVNFETLIELMDNNKINLNETSVLKLRVEELVKEVSRQKCVISDKDEEKREAIRQLCYSLEFYRSGYRELKLKEEQLIKQKELSEEEICKLKIQIEKNENRLDSVQEELNLKVEKLQKHIAKLDPHIIPSFGITA